MVSINEKQAREFLEKITSKDKVAIIHHDDLDGFASGILLYDFCLKKGVSEKNMKPFTLPIGADQKELVVKISKFDKILIADLAPNTIIEVLRFASSKDNLYIDHHVSDEAVPEGVMELRELKVSSASKIIYDLIGTKNEFLKVAALIADVGWKYQDNRDKLKSYLDENDLEIEDVKSDAIIIGYSLIYFCDDLGKMFDILRGFENWSEVEKLEKYSILVEKDFNDCIDGFEDNKEVFGKILFYYFEPKYGIKSMAINAISFPRPSDVFVFAAPNDKEMIKLSARNQTREYDMIELLKAGTSGLKNASCGGHVPAAGGFIQAKDLGKLKENLKKYAEGMK